MSLKLRVQRIGLSHLLQSEGLIIERSRPGLTVGGSEDDIFLIDCFDWSNGMRCQVFDTRPDTEFHSETKLHIALDDPACNMSQALSRGGTTRMKRRRRRRRRRCTRLVHFMSTGGDDPSDLSLGGRGLHSFSLKLNLSTSWTCP
jgi:hypothetical protein